MLKRPRPKGRGRVDESPRKGLNRPFTRFRRGRIVDCQVDRLILDFFVFDSFFFAFFSKRNKPILTRIVILLPFLKRKHIKLLDNRSILIHQLLKRLRQAYRIRNR